ncbi:MAG: multiheme c-type cytochrome [Actinomycetota bacterium]
MKTVKLFLILTTFGFGIYFCFGNYLSTYGQIRIQKKDLFANWLPNREIPGVKFVGSETCNSCHTKESQSHSSMAHALVKPQNSQFWDKFPAAKFQNGGYSYKFTKQGERLIYTVSNGPNEISEPVIYGFGEGRAGQVFVFRHNNEIYESRVTFYNKINNLDFTIAQTRDKPTSLEDALGRIIPANEVQNCFSCHSAAAVIDRKLQIETLQTGVNCEACHGPGENHLVAVKSNNSQDLQIFNPAKLSPIDLSQEFCGSCHVGFDKVLEMSGEIVTVRFQPYRLFNSEGHNPNDARLSCIACHSPHDKIIQTPTFYDAKCLTCHLSNDKNVKKTTQTAPFCPVKNENCVTCHMPKTEVPDMHFNFTDHWIRVVRANEKIPK